MSNGTQSTSRTGKGGSGSEILLDRSSSRTASAVRGVPESTKDASAGVDRVNYADYEKQAHQNIKELHERLKSKTYRVQPLRRVYIPKEDGKAQKCPGGQDRAEGGG